MVRSWIEFHDSVVDAVVASGEGVSIHLTAYVHRWEQRDGAWVGTGWTQPVTIVVRKPTTRKPECELPVEIAGGSVWVNDTVYDNMVPLPFQANGGVRVVIELLDGARLEIAGDDVALTASGDSEFVEDLPADLRPHDLGA